MSVADFGVRGLAPVCFRWEVTARALGRVEVVMLLMSLMWPMAVSMRTMHKRGMSLSRLNYYTDEISTARDTRPPKHAATQPVLYCRYTIAVDANLQVSGLHSNYIMAGPFLSHRMMTLEAPLCSPQVGGEHSLGTMGQSSASLECLVFCRSHTGGGAHRSSSSLADYPEQRSWPLFVTTGELTATIQSTLD